MVVNITALKTAMHKAIIEPLDHKAATLQCTVSPWLAC